METSIRYASAAGPAYLLGRPASRWIDALSSGRRARPRASDRPLPTDEGRP
jgi:hypothetical protein